MTKAPRTPLLCVALAVVAGAACRENSASDEAIALLAEVRSEEYGSWARAPGYTSRRPAVSPHEEEVEIFVNGVVADALAGPPLAQWPEGSVIVKEGYSSGELEIIAVLSKRDGSWFWAEYDAEGAPLFSGAPSLCTDCHAAGSDFVRAFDLP